MQASQILTAPEVVTWLKLSLPYVRLLTAQNKIPHVKIGRRVLYRAGELERWLESKSREEVTNGNSHKK